MTAAGPDRGAAAAIAEALALLRSVLLEEVLPARAGAAADRDRPVRREALSR